MDTTDSMFNRQCSMFNVLCSMFNVKCSMFEVSPATNHLSLIDKSTPRRDGIVHEKVSGKFRVGNVYLLNGKIAGHNFAENTFKK